MSPPSPLPRTLPSGTRTTDGWTLVGTAELLNSSLQYKGDWRKPGYLPSFASRITLIDWDSLKEPERR